MLSILFGKNFFSKKCFLIELLKSKIIYDSYLIRVYYVSLVDFGSYCRLYSTENAKK
jgi:hypothetical protein